MDRSCLIKGFTNAPWGVFDFVPIRLVPADQFRPDVGLHLFQEDLVPVQVNKYITGTDGTSTPSLGHRTFRFLSVIDGEMSFVND